MLVLTRKTQQQIQIGPNITITVLQVKGQAVRLGIEAPRDVSVLRTEVAQRIAAEEAAHDAGEHSTVIKKHSPSDVRCAPATPSLRLGTVPSPGSATRKNPRCRAPRAERAPLLDYLKRTGPASFTTLAEVVR